MSLTDFLPGILPFVAGAAPPAAPGPLPAPVNQTPASGPRPRPRMPMSQPPSAPAWLQALPALFALGARMGGAPTVGTAAIQGAQQGEALREEQQRRQAELDTRRFQVESQAQLQEAAIAERAAQEQRLREAEERRLAEARAKFVMDAKKAAQDFTTPQEFDQFLTFAETMGAQSLGLRPGALRGMVKFTPKPIRDRAAAFVEKQREIWKAEKRDPATLEGVAFDFDVDLDGQLERKTYRELQEMAGEAAYTPDGKPYVPAPPRTLTFGQAFPQARGTVLADKPMPVTSTGDPDYSRGLTDLQRALRLSGPARGQSRAQAQAQARADFEAAVLAGESTDKLTPRFAPLFKPLGLNVNVEHARIRERLLGIGNRVTPESARDLDNLSPEDLIERGRSTLTGSAATAQTTTPPPARTPREVKRTGDPLVIRNPALRAAARKVMQTELQRRGGGPVAITDAQIDVFLSDAHNVRLLEQGGSR